MKPLNSFMNDADGFSAKDYLMVSFGTVFILMVVVAFIVSLVGTLPAVTISVIGLLNGVVITIVGGVFGIQGIKEFKSTSTQEPIQSNNPTYNVVEPEVTPVKLP